MTTTTTTPTTTTANKSESIFTILENQQTLTMVKGEGYQTMVLPATMPTVDQFSNADELQLWAEDNGILHAIMQKGIQKHLIDLRAKFRQAKKDETWNLDTAQENVDDMEWAVVTKPNQNNKKVEDAKRSGHYAAGKELAQAMRTGAGLDDATIMTSLTPVYGPEVAKAIIDGMN